MVTEPIKEYEKEVQRLQKEIARREEAVSNYNLPLPKIKEYQKEIEKYKKLLKEQNQTIVTLTAALNDKEKGRI